MTMVQVRQNPLPPGRYEVDLYTPTERTPHVRDGVQIFNHWRETNHRRVRAVKAETWDTHPRHTRVVFDVAQAPGAWPFGQLGTPERTAEVGAIASFSDAVLFMLDPLAGLESSLAEAAGTFLGGQMATLAKPELAELRTAILIVQVNISLIRANLEAVRNHTSPHPELAIPECRRLIKESLEALVHAVGALVTVDYPRRLVQTLIDDLRALEKAILDAPQKALDFVEEELKNLARDVGAPISAAALGALAVGAALYFATTGKGGKSNNNLLIIGAAAIAVGGSTLFQNIQHPAPLPSFGKK